MMPVKVGDVSSAERETGVVDVAAANVNEATVQTT